MKLIDAEIRRRQMLSVLVYAAIQLLSLISPYLMGRIIDDFIPNRRLPYIYGGIALFAAIPFLSVFLQTIYNYATIKFVRTKGNQFALQIMEKLIYKEISYFDKENSLELLSYSSKEAVGYLNFYIADLSKYYVSMILAAAIFLLLFAIQPVLALLQVLYIPLAYFPVKKIMKSVEQEIGTVVQKNAEINQVKGDIFKAIEFIKLCRLEQRKLEEVDRHNGAINHIWGKIAALDSLSGIWTSGFVTVLFTGLTFGSGAILILNGSNLLVGQLLSIITYCALFYANINSILQTLVNKKKQESEYAKVLSYLELEGERERDHGKQKFELRDSIRFDHCSFSYQASEPVLQDVSLEFKKGCWTGIVGASGSGKSTILDLIMKLYQVPDGSVFFDSVDVNAVDCFSIRENIAKITQDIFLFPGTIEDNLKLMCPDATEEEMRQVLDFACLSDYIRTLPRGIRTDVGEAGKLMSGGERQRLSIAMGILRKRNILLLDEVTASLDPEVEAQLAQNFHTLTGRGYTIISISHKYDFLKYADAIYEVKNGQAFKKEIAVQ